MPQILDTPGINEKIARIMEGATKFIVIICPYLKITEKLRRTIEIADRKGVKTFLLYGKKDLDVATYRWLKSLKNSNIGHIQELHAKLYLNEDQAVMTSMNLYEYSQVNNEELGVWFSRKEDKTLYRDLSYQVVRMFNLSIPDDGTWDISDIERPLKGLRERLAKPTQETARESAGYADPEVYCIRCGDTIPLSGGSVYCFRCLESWYRYGNFGYTEMDGHCVICDRYNNSSADRPACVVCNSMYSDVVLYLRNKMRDNFSR